MQLSDSPHYRFRLLCNGAGAHQRRSFIAPTACRLLVMLYSLQQPTTILTSLRK